MRSSTFSRWSPVQQSCDGIGFLANLDSRPHVRVIQPHEKRTFQERDGSLTVNVAPDYGDHDRIMTFSRELGFIMKTIARPFTAHTWNYFRNPLALELL
jgi:hypothetical protein